MREGREKRHIWKRGGIKVGFACFLRWELLGMFVCCWKRSGRESDLDAGERGELQEQSP